MFSDFFLKNHAVYEVVLKNMVQSQTGHRLQYNTAHAVGKLVN
jgi:hypothetical protein